MATEESAQEVRTRKLQYTPDEILDRFDISRPTLEEALEADRLESIETIDGRQLISSTHLKQWLRTCDTPLPEEL